MKRKWLAPSGRAVKSTKMARAQKVKAVKLRTPTPALIRQAIVRWSESEKSNALQESLALLFQKHFPRNLDLPEVLLKVCALNSFYSTNIYDTHSVAKHIVKMDVDQRLAQGDPSLVNELALVTVAGKEKKFYSFASKYCCHHNPTAFPIYDSFVDKALMHYSRTDGFAKFKRDDLKVYPKFVEIIESFRKHYGLGKFSVRQLDKFLWFEGKEAFGKSKKANTDE